MPRSRTRFTSVCCSMSTTGSPTRSPFICQAPTATRRRGATSCGGGTCSRSFAPAALRMTGWLAPRKEKTETSLSLFCLPQSPGAVILSERAERARAKDLHAARVVRLQVPRVRRVRGVCFVRAVGVARHAVERQRGDRRAHRGVPIGALEPRVGVQQEVTRPAGGQRWCGARVERQRGLVSRCDDHVHVVGRAY